MTNVPIDVANQKPSQKKKRYLTGSVMKVGFLYEKKSTVYRGEANVVLALIYEVLLVRHQNADSSAYSPVDPLYNIIHDIICPYSAWNYTVYISVS